MNLFHFQRKNLNFAAFVIQCVIDLFMKTLKIKIALLSLLFPIFAQAELVTCIINESVAGTTTGQSTYVLGTTVDQNLALFEGKIASGWIAQSGNYTVIQIQTKADNRNFSLRGKQRVGEEVSGITCLSDAITCVTVTCK